MRFDLASLSDLDEIMTIEKQGFNSAEAGSVEGYRERIQKLNKTFLVAKDDSNKVIGFICGPAVSTRFVKDEMYDKTPDNMAIGGHQLIFTIAISPNFRGQGIGSRLLNEFEKIAKRDKRESIALTCLKDRIPFYEKNGFKNMGQADSNHGNEIWFNMEKII
ncbi:GNAT family N-acetyltransferase [Companilactobacillus keshanensis]|uniref:GNAT family N-acetyltransferase n=1 Tax=Companilactobacillus keshanensis TaxID=2486003 RepID=A0ABW4BTZ1_9LACO|nr:GNAT family N-acetyltransferase [Companilactobacillus keshanensis]